MDRIIDFQATDYTLQSVSTGQVFDDSGWLLNAPGESQPTLIRAIYQQKQLQVRDNTFGLYRFADWLPIHTMLRGSSAPITYQSEGLAKKLGLSKLFITFSGWWPEKGATMKTCSFKETEAYTVCARLNPQTDKILVVASAGNTARSFARVCSDNHIPLLLCMPEDNIDSMWFDEPINEYVKLIVTCKGSDYFDAIHLSDLACKHPRFFPEGGAKNVARRDGMGTTVLSAVTTIGEIPEYYFQAIGSGTGAIAAWEANLRLIADGRFGNRKMKLMVSQNEPFIPIKLAWEAGSRNILPMAEDEARQQAAQINAKVLSNRKPPYGIAGGLYDALKDNSGNVLSASNIAAVEASALFMETEGIDIHPAAAIATATLIHEVRKKNIHPQALIMLNVTGGGEQHFKQGRLLHTLQPSHVFDITPGQEAVHAFINRLFP